MHAREHCARAPPRHTLALHRLHIARVTDYTHPLSLSLYACISRLRICAAVTMRRAGVYSEPHRAALGCRRSRAREDHAFELARAAHTPSRSFESEGERKQSTRDLCPLLYCCCYCCTCACRESERLKEEDGCARIDRARVKMDGSCDREER